MANRLSTLLLSSFVMAEPMAVSAVLPHFMTPVRGKDLVLMSGYWIEAGPERGQAQPINHIVPIL